MGTSAEKEYADFEDKVKRTVYFDNLSPKVKESVLKTALSQFGTVVGVQFIPNYSQFNNMPLCALVEMESLKDAKNVTTEIVNYPFMISGMPRPVRARPAEAQMFTDRPVKPGRKIQCRWVDPKEPYFQVATELKSLARNHAKEALCLLQLQLEEEEKLAKEQAESLKEKYNKFKIIDNLLIDGTMRRLASCYNMNVADE
ncbi:hypothetical protein Scep_024979 [Stephania cephalantha]|uniref:RRM domain-containing protein n=1 Tax=Stephania cephalantha TaxID=152367 RepID=A0AAP0HZ42_9MAGN